MSRFVDQRPIMFCTDFEQMLLDLRIVERAEIADDVPFTEWPSQSVWLKLTKEEQSIVHRVKCSQPHVYPLDALNAPESVKFERMCVRVIGFQVPSSHMWPSVSEFMKMTMEQRQTVSMVTQNLILVMQNLILDMQNNLNRSY